MPPLIRGYQMVFLDSSLNIIIQSFHTLIFRMG
jgi:hypothetical protein